MTKGKRHFFILSGFAVITTIIILVIFNKRILTKNCPVKSDVLVIEGWLPSSDLELIQKEIDLKQYKTIYVTGVAHNHPEYLKDRPQNKYFTMPTKFFSDGCLCLGKKALARLKTINNISEIKVFAHGHKGLGLFPNFYVAINDSVIGNSFVTDHPDSYTFHGQFVTSELKGIYLYFNNCSGFGKNSRILIVDSISVNDIVLKETSDFYRIDEDQIDDNHYINYPFRSNAVLTTSYLKLLGVTNNIVTIDTFFNFRNKTLAAAKKLESYLNTYSANVNSYNVVSIHRHSRRSYFAYKIATRNHKDIGIISINDYTFPGMYNKKLWFIRITEAYAKFFVTYLEYLFSW